MVQEDRRLTERADKEPIREQAYIYKDSSGLAVMRKIRVERYNHPKNFRLEACIKGRWQPNLQGLNGERHTLYNLSALREAIRKGETVYINEGEKACDYMALKGMVGTCQAFGADANGSSKWKPQQTQEFTNANVVIVADRDTTGEEYARYIASQVASVALSCKVVQSKTTRDKDDAYDHLAAGFTETDFVIRRDLMPKRGLEGDVFSEENFNPVTAEFLIEPYVRVGKCFLVDADGGTNKSSLLLSWAASLSKGIEPVSFRQIEPVKTLYLHKGEDQSDELATVFQACGGDLSMIKFVQNDSLVFDNAGLKAIEEEIEDGGFRFVVVDAFYYFLQGLMQDTYNALPALEVMQRVNAVAAKTRASFADIRHTTRSQVGRAASELGMGSVQFRNSHRGQIVLRWHPTMKNTVVATSEKGSILSPKGEHFCFQRRGNAIEYLSDLENPFDPSEQPKVNKTEQAKMFLKRHCTGVWVKVEWLKQLAREEDIPWATIEKAKVILSVEHSRLGKHESHWMLRDKQEDPFE